MYLKIYYVIIFRVWPKKARAYISSNFSTIGSEYSGIFYMNPTLKNDKNPNLMIKKLELIVALPFF